MGNDLKEECFFDPFFWELAAESLKDSDNVDTNIPQVQLNEQISLK